MQNSTRSTIFDEVKTTLSEKSNTQKEKSWAVHSVFGEWLNLIFDIDKEWLLQHLDAIFPIEKENQKYFLAAWESFIYYNNPNIKIFPLLREKYIQAIYYFAEGKKLTPQFIREKTDWLIIYYAIISESL